MPDSSAQNKAWPITYLAITFEKAMITITAISVIRIHFSKLSYKFTIFRNASIEAPPTVLVFQIKQG
jgi:uncharacterized membrane protein YcaP (DUF421 family)